MEKLEIELKKEDFGREYSGKYIFVGISWGVTNRITGECTNVNPLTRASTINIKELQAKTLMATLIDKPAKITLQHLMDESDKGLPSALGDLLMSAADKVNGFSSKEREDQKKLKERWGLD